MASYPVSVKTFATRSAGQTIGSAHINDLQDEVTAIEGGLINGLQHVVTAVGLDVGSTGRINAGPSSVASLSVSGGSTFAGAVTIAAGLSFPATQAASTGANVFDDYEELPWTPVIGGAGGESGQTYSVQSGRYIKKGKEITASCRVDLTAKGTITGAVQIKGFPLAADTVTSLYTAASIYFEGMASNFVSLMGTFEHAGGTAMTVRGLSAAAASYSGLTTTDIGNTTLMIMTVTYQAAS